MTHRTYSEVLTVVITQMKDYTSHLYIHRCQWAAFKEIKRCLVGGVLVLDFDFPEKVRQQVHFIEFMGLSQQNTGLVQHRNFEYAICQSLSARARAPLS